MTCLVVALPSGFLNNDVRPFDLPVSTQVNRPQLVKSNLPQQGNRIIP